MKIKFLVLCLMAAMAGCSGDAPEAGAPAVTPSAETTAAASNEACVNHSFYAPLPDEAITFDFPYHLQADRIYSLDSGETRRRVVLEYLDGDAGQVWAGVVKSLESAGYKQSSDAGEGKGSFSKAGASGLYVAVTAGPVENPANPEARGTVWISWQLKPASGAGA